MDAKQLDHMRSGKGFVAALDQSGGSTPRALAAYGIAEGSWKSEEEMFDLVHAMRTRIVTSPAFTSQRILGAILFEQTMERSVEGLMTARYLWEKKGVVPFLKVDKGLAPAENGVQMMKPFPDLDSLLDRAVERGIFGTKMRSLVKEASPKGIEDVVSQQFQWAEKIIAKGLVPIVEPEVDIHAEHKDKAEELLKEQIVRRLDELAEGQNVILKLTLPTKAGFYADLGNHKRVLRVMALSGGYSRDKACELLALNHRMIASFSRALTEGLLVGQSDDEFNSLLDRAIEKIFNASVK